MKLYDGFTFYNELDLLELRLTELGGIVDHFIVVEATLTFTGKPKPLIFEQNKARFAKWADKIIHVVVDDFPPTDNAWDREHWQRRAIGRGLKNAQADDFVIIGDVDEIPKPTQLRTAITNTASRGALTIFEARMYSYALNMTYTKDPYSIALGPRMLQRKHMLDAQAVRAFRPRHSKKSTATTEAPWRRAITWLRKWRAFGAPLRVNVLRDAAWHFSYIGDAEFIRNKFLSFSHTEVATAENTDIETIRQKLLAGVSILYPDNPMTTVAMTELPSSVQENPARWQQFLSS